MSFLNSKYLFLIFPVTACISSSRSWYYETLPCSTPYPPHQVSLGPLGIMPLLNVRKYAIFIGVPFLPRTLCQPSDRLFLYTNEHASLFNYSNFIHMYTEWKWKVLKMCKIAAIFMVSMYEHSVDLYVFSNGSYIIKLLSIRWYLTLLNTLSAYQVVSQLHLYNAVFCWKL